MEEGGGDAVVRNVDKEGADDGDIVDGRVIKSYDPQKPRVELTCTQVMG